MIHNVIEYTTGSVVGYNHLQSGKVLIGRNNQDAYAIRMTDDAFLGIICDGCGSGKHSEIGAKLGANILANEFMTTKKGPDLNFEATRRNTLAQICMLANNLMPPNHCHPTEHSSFSNIINDYFLFTIMGLYIARTTSLFSAQTKYRVTTFSLGDGCIYYNKSYDTEHRNHLKVIDQSNIPNYLAYGLVNSSISDNDLNFKTEYEFNLEELQGIAIASDGFTDWANQPISTQFPGTNTDIDPFWSVIRSDKYFSNRDYLNRRLRMMNSSRTKLEELNENERRLKTYHPILPDDTTIIAVRLKK